MWAVQAAAALLAVSATTTTLVWGKTLDHISLGGNANNCDILYETVRTQKCSPTNQKECKLVVFNNERVEYKQKCVEVTSVHCPTSRKPLIQKREAEAEPEADAEADPYYYNQWYQPAAATALYHPFYQPVYQQRPITRVPAAAFIAAQKQQPKPVPAKPVDTPAAAATATSDGCHQVISEHCYKVPEVIKEPTEVKKCHDVTRMQCTPFEHKVPKTICKPVKPEESVPVSPSRVFKAQPLYNPFAYDRL